MKVTIGGRVYAVDRKNLERILGRPPTDRKVVEFRRQIMAELVTVPGFAPRSRGRVRALCTNFDPCSKRRPFRAVSTRAAGDSISSPPPRRPWTPWAARLPRARRVSRNCASSASGHWPAMRTVGLRDLLDYEENLSTLDVRVRLGIDGRVRGLEMLADQREREQLVLCLAPGQVLGQALVAFPRLSFQRAGASRTTHRRCFRGARRRARAALSADRRSRVLSGGSRFSRSCRVARPRRLFARAHCTRAHASRRCAGAHAPGALQPAALGTGRGGGAVRSRHRRATT